MKQITIALAAGELEDLAEILEDQIRVASKSVTASDRRPLLSLYLKVTGAAVLAGGWADFNVAQVPWVIPMIQEAIAGADQVPELTRKVQALESQLKAATKKPAPAKKPKPKPKPAPFKTVGPNKIVVSHKGKPTELTAATPSLGL